jgi:DNA-binding NarL/FixJ family response regulator
MPRIFLANSRPEERSTLRQMLLEMKIDVVGESADWLATLAQAPSSSADRVVVDWDMLPNPPSEAFEVLRKACPAHVVIVLLSRLDARQQAALSVGADAFISKDEMPERVAERLRIVAASIPAR